MNILKFTMIICCIIIPIIIASYAINHNNKEAAIAFTVAAALGCFVTVTMLYFSEPPRS